MGTLLADHALTPQGWLSDCAIEFDPSGTIVRVEGGCSEGTRVRGFVVPGMPNVHSHAFQRALAGLTENGVAGSTDSFWTWREQMYRLAESITPDDLEAIATLLYVEMLEAGMTSVGEFHYVHHDRGGAPFADPTEMSQRIVAAADRAGIALTLLPVLYLHGGFGKEPVQRQRRFVHRDVEHFLSLVNALEPTIRKYSHFRLGIAPHSLRAALPKEIIEAARGRSGPVHVHVAEQRAEVEDCLLHLGARPVQTFFDQVIDQLPNAVPTRFTLVHATHLDERERKGLAGRRLMAGLCPTTEANLGDGLFPAEAYVGEGGAFSIGSDSHISVSVTEELRLLEYGQRLITGRRNVIDGAGSVGQSLFLRATRGGATSLDQPVGAIEVGRRADLVALDETHPRLVAHSSRTVLDAFIFGGADRAVRDVWVSGRHIVREGHHEHGQAVRERWAHVARRLLAAPLP